MGEGILNASCLVVYISGLGIYPFIVSVPYLLDSLYFNCYPIPFIRFALPHLSFLVYQFHIYAQPSSPSFSHGL